MSSHHPPSSDSDSSLTESMVNEILRNIDTSEAYDISDYLIVNEYENCYKEQIEKALKNFPDINWTVFEFNLPFPPFWID